MPNLNHAEISRERLMRFLEMIVRYGATTIKVTDNPVANLWLVEWVTEEN